MEKQARNTYYEARGSVRGACGHKHQSEKAAHACAQKDQRDCARLPGGNSYSDRVAQKVSDSIEGV